MKNNYRILSYQKWLVMISWLVSLTLSLTTRAQAPVIQWQRSIEPVLPGAVSGRSAIVKNSSGGYFVVTADRRLVALTTAGDVLSDTPIKGITENGTPNEALSTVSPVPTTDGNVVVGVLDNQSWTIQKRNASGGVLWASKLNFSVSPQYDYSVSSIVASSDGGFVAFATRYDRTYADPFAPDATYVIITKVDQTGYLVWTKELRYLTPGGPNNSLLYTNGTRVNKAVNTPNGGYLLVGTANATTSNSTIRGWAAKLDGSGNVVWQRHYEQMNELNDVAADLSGTDAYFLNGFALPGTAGLYASSTLRIDASGNPTNAPVQVPYQPFNSLATVVGVLPSERPLVYLVGNDTPMDDNKGDIRLTGFSDQGTVVWTKTLGGSGRDYNFKPAILPVPDGYIVAGITESNDGDVKGRQTATPATWIVKLQNPANALKLIAPTYNCQTGAITFNTTGGDGSPITYSAPGITRSSATSNTGTIEQELRNDPKPITITANQSGQSTTYSFDFGAYCNGTQPPVNPPTGGSLVLLAPTYDCQSGAIHFNTSGGNGSPVEFKSIGITDWTVNPNQFVDKDSRTANDVQPFTLMARQNGQVVTYTWDLKAACGRLRLSVEGTKATLSLIVLGNPVRDQLRVRVEGAEGQSVRLRLTDVRGQLLETRVIEQAGPREEPEFRLDRSGPGLFLLQAVTDSEQKIVKVINQ